MNDQTGTAAFSDAPALLCRELSWQPKGRGTPVLDRIFLEFEPGFVYGIIGPNGSGKSSLLRHIMGFLPVTRGEVLWGGRKVSEYSRRQLAKITAYVPQETRLDTDFTAEEVVMTGRNPYQSRFGGADGEDRAWVERALNFTGSTHLADQPFRSLSGGEAQKVIIARAIAQNTPWIVLDEPVSGLDVKNETEILERLKALNRDEKRSILIVLHDINLAARCCDRIVMLKNGTVLFAGDAAQGFSCERLEQLYEIPFEQLEYRGQRHFFPVSAFSDSADV